MTPQASSRSLWSISYGDYELTVDRRALAYCLTETKTNTVWANWLSLGWVELEERETGAITRHDFGSLRCISVSEKSGVQGKRILFGLDIHGVPIDIYLICSQREIQIQVEANRDSKNHKIAGFGLAPGLCAVTDKADSFLVFPLRDGAILYARDAPETPLPLPIWESEGLTMPFVGAVRDASALTLITDSVYAAFVLCRHPDNAASLDLQFERDPERRRLDMRLILLPHGDPVLIAQTYREKIIGENNHVTLRRKIRERPALDSVIGAAFLSPYVTADIVAERLNATGNVHFLVDGPERAPGNDVKGTMLAADTFKKSPNRWETIDARLSEMAALKSQYLAVGSLTGGDWSAIALDYWTQGIARRDPPPAAKLQKAVSVPLYAVVYHDSVIATAFLNERWIPRFLSALLNLSLPHFAVSQRSLDDAPKEDSGTRYQMIQRICAVLGPLHRLTLSAFLTAHCFLTPDFKVEQAIYSDKTCIIINQSDNDIYETPELTLPPLGFYVRHAQMEAHDALRVGDTIFSTRAWRIRQARDGKPLETSGDTISGEFPPPGD